MTDQEKINEALQRQIDAQNARIENVLTKVDMLVIESQQQREDMRRMNEKIDSNQKEFTQQLHTNFVQTMIGVGAIMAAIGGLIIATLK